MSDQNELRSMVEEIDEIISEIGSEWECDFIDNVMDWNGDYTPKQEEVIRRIYKKACNSPY